MKRIILESTCALSVLIWSSLRSLNIRCAAVGLPRKTAVLEKREKLPYLRDALQRHTRASEQLFSAAFIPWWQACRPIYAYPHPASTRSNTRQRGNAHRRRYIALFQHSIFASTYSPSPASRSTSKYVTVCGEYSYRSFRRPPLIEMIFLEGLHSEAMLRRQVRYLWPHMRREAMQVWICESCHVQCRCCFVNSFAR